MSVQSLPIIRITAEEFSEMRDSDCMVHDTLPKVGPNSIRLVEYDGEWRRINGEYYELDANYGKLRFHDNQIHSDDPVTRISCWGETLFTIQFSRPLRYPEIVEELSLKLAPNYDRISAAVAEAKKVGTRLIYELADAE
jgi:hypothetical protein